MSVWRFVDHSAALLACAHDPDDRPELRLGGAYSPKSEFGKVRAAVGFFLIERRGST